RRDTRRPRTRARRTTGRRTGRSPEPLPDRGPGTARARDRLWPSARIRHRPGRRGAPPGGRAVAGFVSFYGGGTAAALRAGRALDTALGDGAFGVAHCPRDRPSTVFSKPAPRSVYGAGLLP